MKTCFTAMALGYLFLSSSILFSQSNALHESLHRASFSLAGEESTLPQFFIMQSRFITYEADGVRSNEDVVTLYLQTETKKEGNRILTTYKCKKFSFKFGKEQLLFVPSLANWSYKLSEDTSGIDEKGQVFGIPHSKFDNLMDNAGKPVPPDKSYMVYNTFIDFHSFCNVFAKKTLSGKGIQDLHTIGDKIVHSSAFSEPPVNLGKNISEGSFKNGEITLSFDGVSVVNDKLCALIHFDSGESSFKMTMKPMPNMSITTVGGSHYSGDIYLDVNSKWVQKVVMSEMVVSQTKLPFPPNLINSITERISTIRNVQANHFETE